MYLSIASAALALLPFARAQSASATAPAAAPTVAPTSTFTGTYTLYATNPTAVPLSALIASPATQPTVALAQTYAAGATPSIPGAPPLPTFVLTTGTYPALDITPPTDSAFVQGWIAKVAASGITIPNIAPTVAGGCATNPAAAAAAAQNGWWTCGGHTRPTDIVTCADKMTWGLSYDDGPSPYSTDLVNYLGTQNIKSTFFIVGSRAISRPDILRAEYMAGHQLSVHTWAHPYLTTLTNEQIIAELAWTMKAIKDITGVTPNTFRPPYGDCDDRVRAIATAMGLTNIIWTSTSQGTFDTNDWHIPSGFPVAQVLSTFDSILTQAPTLNTGFIVLAHDLYQQTVDLAVGYVIPDALARNFTLKPIISCLNQPLANAYIETNNNSTNPPGKGAATLQPGASGAATPTGKSSASQSHNAAMAVVGGNAGVVGVVLAGLMGLVVGF
ncbi:carbohydrate esterase family 4 protein [Botryobasidium botryosum FD-172 SS1]|uniref:chitin deacetylase n=1 Tax=Botryobasidium botryosum (strain FD-172 SS1) TaxID=930990 RepID=A0A067MF34_BOTB1|nr:carbohydrate esterase family 4 protein [Botryobasidium botryosum FD-172 SS1]